MKKLIVVAALLLTACGWKTEKSEILSEPAVVRDVIYAPSQHGSGTGVGMTMKGSLVVTSESISIPAKYAIVFECKHGKFIVEGSKEKHKALWKRLKVGQEVTVTYHEVWRIYEDDGRRELVKMDFVDAI